MNKRTIALKRSQFYQEIRNFFNAQGYAEVETPLLSPDLIPESSIEVFKTQRLLSNGKAQDLFLTPSPELYMKQLISEGIGDCYQLTKAFRNVEDSSQKHANEFTMLEWYAMDKHYLDNVRITQALLRHLAPLAAQSTQHYFLEFTQVTMNQLFQDFVGIDLEKSSDFESFQNQARLSGFNDYADQSNHWEDLFNFLFVSNIEPNLPKDKTLFILNYPSQIPTTAKKTGQHYERWEFYMAGWEIANCYTEEARYDEMVSLFKAEGQLKNEMMVPHPVNMSYLDIFKNDTFPPCSGTALGVDRLFALAMNAQSLEEISLI